MGYSITRPARETLFTIVTPEEKYKAKNVIDTVVYRGGDAVSGWFFALLKAGGVALTAIMGIGIGIALVWIVFGLRLGKKHEGMPAHP